MMHPLLFLLPAVVCGAVTVVALIEVVHDHRNGLSTIGPADAFGAATAAAAIVVMGAGTVVSLAPVMAWALGVVL